MLIIVINYYLQQGPPWETGTQASGRAGSPTLGEARKLSTRGHTVGRRPRALSEDSCDPHGSGHRATGFHI